MKKIKSSIILVNKFRNFVLQLNFLLKNSILLSFSGGQDSICLILLLLQLVGQFNFNFGTIYCNHIWGFNSLCSISHTGKVNFIFNKNFFFVISTKKIFSEKCARFWRYLSVCRVAQFYNYKMIVTGHTKTDQIETLLLNLFRGSGKMGLSVFTNFNFIKNKSPKQIFLSENELN